MYLHRRPAGPCIVTPLQREVPQAPLPSMMSDLPPPPTEAGGH